MAKFSNALKLPAKEREELMIYFCQALSSLKNASEAAKFLTDLISPQEAEMLAKRLKIAQLLIQGKKYEEIRTQLKVSHATIARINIWLNLSGEGFRTIIKRTQSLKKKPVDPQDKYDYLSWHNIKRRYHWPLALLEEILEESDEKHRQKILLKLEKMKPKAKLFKDINQEIYERYSPKKKRTL